MPSVSVVIPTHNRAKMVLQAVQSVLNQTFKDLECIVVDDGGTDNTAELLTGLDPRVVLIRHEHSKHASAARNTGIQASSGDFIAFLDDDDLWKPHKLQRQLDELKAFPSHGMCSCWMTWINPDNKVVLTSKPSIQGNLFDLSLVTQPIGNTSTLLVTREVMNEVGGFDPSIPRGNDDDFIRRVAEITQIRVVQEALIDYRVGHPDRITEIHRTEYQKRISAEKKKLRRYKEAFAARPRASAIVLSRIARWHYLAGQKRLALSYWRQAVSADPTCTTIYRDLIQGLRKR